MTPELFYLLMTAVLSGCLWIPSVIGQATTRGMLQPVDYVIAPSSPLPHWANRANRAHLNAVENIGSFAAIVLVAHLTGVHTVLTAAAATAFFYLRALHAIVHIIGFKHAMARTVIFTLAWLAMLTIAVQVLIHAA